MEIAVLPPNTAAAIPPRTDTGWRTFYWVTLVLAALSRLVWLDGRPPHFDEGVNGWFTDQMRHLGCYQYDPTNYHGPLHFYVLFFFKSLLGRNVWALRLPTAIIGVLTVEWCFRFERFFGRRASAWMAVAMLVSPSALYFQRDAIHEAWLLFFLVLGFWGVCGLCQEGTREYLWAAGLALAGAVLTKETWIIHVGCLFIAGACVFLAELLQPSRRPLLRPEDEPPPLPADDARRPGWFTLPETSLRSGFLSETIVPQRWTTRDAWLVAGVVFVLIVFFYSGNFLLFDPDSYGKNAHANGLTWFTNIFAAYTPWGKKADEGEGHQKPFMYWCQLIARDEPWTLAGLLVAVAYTVPALPGAWRRVRTGAVAFAALCAAVLVAAHAWDHPLTGTTAHPTVLRADAGLWWSLGGLVALAGVACVLLPPPGAGRLRIYGALAGAACVGALFLPWVYPAPGLFTAAFVGVGGGVAALSLPAPPDWRVRLLAIYGVGALLAYSIIRYKTPWCMISLTWPFFLTGGVALADLAERFAVAGREAAMGVGAALSVLSGAFAADLNYHRPTDDSLDFVYVQSFNDVWTVSNFLLDEARANPTFYQQPGVILCDSTYPLPWLLGDFENIGYYTNDRHPADPDGYHVVFLLVTERRVEEAEARLDDTYYKQAVRLRPALDELQLYLRASRFKHLMPADRTPEFTPVPTAPAAPADEPAMTPGEGSPATGAPSLSSSPDDTPEVQ